MTSVKRLWAGKGNPTTPFTKAHEDNLALSEMHTKRPPSSLAHYSHRPKRPRSASPRSYERQHRSRSTHDNDRRIDNVILPFNQRSLRKRDLDTYLALFTDYLHVQKQLNIKGLDHREIQGRWKSFLGKWNRRELSEGWYDPAYKARLDGRDSETRRRQPNDPIEEPEKDFSVLNKAQRRIHESRTALQDKHPGNSEHSDSDSSADDIGPNLPSPDARVPSHARPGPVLPLPQDLQLRDEQRDDDVRARRADERYDRKVDRQTQKERLEELAPRADPGSRERKLEKKREISAVHKSFGDRKSPGAEEMNDRDLMGDNDGDDLRAKKKEEQRRRTERQIRKEEVLRAREAERAERLAGHRAKEEKTMEMLKALAKQRFG